MESPDAKQRAEQIYLAVYENMSLNVEYFQSENVKRQLPELFLTVVVGAVFQAMLHGLAQGFIERFGEKAADYLSEKFRDWAAAGKSPEQIVADLEEAIPTIIQADVDWGQIEARMGLELTQQGMALPTAQKVAAELCRAVREKAIAPS